MVDEGVSSIVNQSHKHKKRTTIYAAPPLALVVRTTYYARFRQNSMCYAFRGNSRYSASGKGCATYACKSHNLAHVFYFMSAHYIRSINLQQVTHLRAKCAPYLTSKSALLKLFSLSSQRRIRPTDHVCDSIGRWRVWPLLTNRWFCTNERRDDPQTDKAGFLQSGTKVFMGRLPVKWMMFRLCQSLGRKVCETVFV